MLFIHTPVVGECCIRHDLAMLLTSNITTRDQQEEIFFPVLCSWHDLTLAESQTIKEKKNLKTNEHSSDIHDDSRYLVNKKKNRDAFRAYCLS